MILIVPQIPPLETTNYVRQMQLQYMKKPCVCPFMILKKKDKNGNMRVRPLTKQEIQRIMKKYQ